MTSSPRSRVVSAAALAAALALSACGKSQPPATPAAAPGTATTTTQPAAATTAAPAASTSAGNAAATPATAATSAAPATSSTTAATPAAAATVPLAVAKLTVGDAVNAAHTITRPGDRFASDDKTIYASVATQGSSTGAMLNAKWSYLEGSGQLISSTNQAIATDGPAITTFKVQNPDLWPEGKYQVEISLDGKAVAKQTFEIGKR
jgi:hypothetical protein